MEITTWHRNAYMLMTGELRLAELVKFWIIAREMHLLEDDVPSIGMSVMDNSRLHEALVLGLIYHFPKNQPISYPQMGGMLNFHFQTIAKSVKRLLQERVLEKRSSGSEGAVYTITQMPEIPLWIMEVTKALVEMESDPEVKKRVFEDCKTIDFKRGFAVLREELREKFYRPHKKE